MKKFSEIKSSKDLRERVKNGTLSVGCHWMKIKRFVSERPFTGSKKIEVIYSPGYGGVAKITRYI